MKENESLILVVDDERDHADGIAEALDKLAAKAIAVYTGKDRAEGHLHRQARCEYGEGGGGGEEAGRESCRGKEGAGGGSPKAALGARET